MEKECFFFVFGSLCSVKIFCAFRDVRSKWILYIPEQNGDILYAWSRLEYFVFAQNPFIIYDTHWCFGSRNAFSKCDSLPQSIQNVLFPNCFGFRAIYIFFVIALIYLPKSISSMTFCGDQSSRHKTILSTSKKQTSFKKKIGKDFSSSSPPPLSGNVTIFHEIFVAIPPSFSSLVTYYRARTKFSTLLFFKFRNEYLRSIQDFWQVNHICSEVFSRNFFWSW